VLLALLVVLRARRRKAAGSPATAAAPAATPSALRPLQPSQTPAVALAAAEAAATLAPVEEDEAVEWPEIEDVQEQALEEPTVAVWSTDEVITEPGWPLPGEVGTSWPAPVQQQDVEPVHGAVADEPALEDETVEVDEPASWDEVDPVQAFDPASGWVVEAEEAQAVEPVEPWTPEAAGEPLAWGEMVAEADAEPVVEAEAELIAEPVVDVEPVFEPVVEAEPVPWQVPAPTLHAVEEPVGVAVEADHSAVDPLARWAAMAPASRNGADAPAVAARRTPMDAWARLRPTSMGPAVDHRVAEALPYMQGAVGRGAPAGPRSGSFALGGYAAQAGEEAVTGISFAEPDQAPRRWRRGPSDNATPGTLVLDVGETLNCDPADVAVITDPGFAPTGEGFIVRIAARAPGPFAARGTYKVS
jgi:hypothetical protein